MIQPALMRAEAIARLSGAQIVAYCCTFDSRATGGADAKNAWLAWVRDSLDRIVASTRAAGIDVEVQLEWNEDWRTALTDAAAASDCDLLVKASSKHSVMHRKFAATSDWMLLRQAVCPTLLVTDKPPKGQRILLAGIKLRPEDVEHERLNQSIVDLSHYISDVAGFDMHAVTAYRGDGGHFDRQRFADSCRLPRNRVHSIEGLPQNALAKAAVDLDADTIVIGYVDSSDSAEKLIDQVDTDILVLPSSSD